MKTTRYLYNVEASDLLTMGYKEALEYKLGNAKVMYFSLYEGENDYDRQFYMNKAINHTQKLLDELDN